MLEPVHEVFGLRPVADLCIFEPGQSLTAITTKTLGRLEQLLPELRPDAVLVQGDTTTAMGTGLAAFYAGIPLIHLEAGLRSNDKRSPFPEEMNRSLLSQLGALHLAPTASSKDNLLREGIAPQRVVVTGNTVIDALLWVIARAPDLAHPRWPIDGRKILLVTAHRRESWGQGLENVAHALANISDRLPDVDIVIPLHRNPIVRSAFARLEDLANVHIVEPLDYVEFSGLMAASCVLLTDSGGVQEEGPSLGKPVLVMRDTTERPEAVDAGVARLVGTDVDTIFEAVVELFTDASAYGAMARRVNPYGDGQATSRCVAAIEELFGLGPRLPDFTPECA